MPIRSIRSDVSNEPGVFSIPDMSDRYYVMPMLDGWSEVFEVASSRTTGGHSQIYVITGPGWSGGLPQGVTQVKSPTGMVWILGRIYSSGTPEDYAAVHALQDKFSVVPLSAYGKPYTPPQGRVDPGIDMKTAVRKQVNDLDIDAYFNTLAELMKTNPPPAQDAPIVARMAEIGLVPGRDFDPSRLGFLDREVIRVVPKLALLEMGLYLKRQKTTNGWLYFTKGVGNWGTNYLLRGMGNLLGPGWNRPQDGVYPLSQKDANGDEYNGADRSYIIRFEKGQLPPAEAFWSLTMYDSNFFFVRAMGGFEKLQEGLKKLKTENGWIVIPKDFANYGTDYDTRAGIAMVGLGGIWPRDVVYPTAFIDGDGKSLDGSNRNVLLFDKGQTPPTNTTWSVSMYDPEGYYVPNAISRYNLAPWMPLKFNADGSLDLYIQATSPGADKEANWLPAPSSGQFNLTVRIFWPTEAVLDGPYKLPPVRKLP